jgi:hypothetical protein
VFDLVGGFTNGVPASQHTEFAHRLLPAAIEQGWRIAGVEAPLIRYYAQSRDGIRSNDKSVLLGAEYLIDRYGDMMRKKDPRRLGSHHATAGYRAARLGERVRARRHLTAAIRYGGLKPKSIGRWLAVVIWPLRPRRWRAGAAPAVELEGSR